MCTYMGIMREQVHELLRHVPLKEAVPVGTLETVTSVQEDGIRFLLQ